MYHDFEDISLCLILISSLELWLMTEESVDMTQMLSATSVHVLLHPNSNRKLQICRGGESLIWLIWH